MATADAADNAADTPPRRSRKPLIFGLAGALLLGGAGFFVTWSGLIGGGEHAGDAAPDHASPSLMADIAFVPVPLGTSTNCSSPANPL